jgi:hypothetical protein
MTFNINVAPRLAQHDAVALIFASTTITILNSNMREHEVITPITFYNMCMQPFVKPNRSIILIFIIDDGFMVLFDSIKLHEYQQFLHEANVLAELYVPWL